MIKKLNIKISFGDYIEFKNQVEIVFYKLIYNRLKQLTCITGLKQCEDCKYLKKCIYSFLSNNDFSCDIIPIILKRDMFSKKVYQKDESITFSLIILGKACEFINYINLVLDHLIVFDNVELKIEYKLESIKQEEKQSTIQLTIPAYYDKLEEIISFEQEKLRTLNKDYQVNINHIENIQIENIDLKQVRDNRRIYIGNKRLYLNGYVGNLSINDTTNMLRLIGFGKYYYLGS